LHIFGGRVAVMVIAEAWFEPYHSWKSWIGEIQPLTLWDSGGLLFRTSNRVAAS
jgi:hypothetical protein